MQPLHVVQGALVPQGPLVQPDHVLAGQAEPPHQPVHGPVVHEPLDCHGPHGLSPPKGPPLPPQPPGPWPFPPGPQDAPVDQGPPVVQGPPEVQVDQGLVAVLQTDGSQSPLELVGQLLALAHEAQLGFALVQEDQSAEFALVHEDQSDLVVHSEGAPDHAVVPEPQGPPG